MEVGSRVLVVGGKTGVVRFMGTTDFAQGEWVGIELDGPDGKNDGEINGVRYFTCEPLYGLFAKKSQVRLARVSLGYGAANPMATSSTTSRLQQMRDKRTSSSTNLIPPSTTTGAAGTKKTIPKVDSSPKLVSSASSVKSPTANKASARLSGVLSPTAASSACKDAPNTVDADMITLELQEANAKINALQAELEAKAARITDLEADIVQATAQLAEATASMALPATVAEGTPAVAIPPPIVHTEDNLPTSPRAMYEEKLRSLRDEGIALAAKMRRDMEITVTKMEKEWEDKEAHMLVTLEAAEARAASLESEVVGLRSRNSALVAAEHARAEEVAQWTAKLGVVHRKVEAQAATIADLQDVVELLTLEKETLAMDKEIAEERIDELEAQAATAAIVQQNAFSTTAASSFTDGSASAVQEENAKLRQALLAMHERYTDEKSTLTKELRDATKLVNELSRYRDEVENVNAKYTAATAAIEELKESLDMASAYESMVETLTETNLALGDEVADLKTSVASLESLKEMSDEMEHQHDMLAKALQEELGAAKQKVADLTAAAAIAATTIEDKDRTILRFRDVVARHRDEVAALREKLRMEAGELESMKDTTQSIMSQSMQLRQALQAAQASNMDANRQKLAAQEMALEHDWWQTLVPIGVLQDADRRQLAVRKMALRVTTKSCWLLEMLAPAVLEPRSSSTTTYATEGDVAEASEKAQPASNHSHEAATALALWKLRQGMSHVTRQLHATTVDTKWQELLLLLDNSWAQVDALLDAALQEWAAEGALSPGHDLQPGVGARLVHAVHEWLRLVGPKLEPLSAVNAVTVGSVKLVLQSQSFQLALQCTALGDDGLRAAVWQLYSRVAAELKDATSPDVLDNGTTHDDVPLGANHTLVDQLNVLVAYSKSVTSIPPFIERVNEWTKQVTKGGLLDALAVDPKRPDKPVLVPLHELRAEHIRTDLAHAASLLAAIEETTEVCHKLQTRVKEMEKADSHARMVIAKHEADIARLDSERLGQVEMARKLADQLETERAQCDALLTEQHKERAALESANRSLRKSLRRVSDLNVKTSPSQDASTADPACSSAVAQPNNTASNKALHVLHEQLLAARIELALARLPPVNVPKRLESSGHENAGLTACSMEVAALTTKVLTLSALPELVDLSKTNCTNDDVKVAQLLRECHAVKAKVSETLAGMHADVGAAVRGGEVFFTGRSCDPRPQDHAFQTKNPVGRLWFAGHGTDGHSIRGGRVVPVVLNAAEMRLLSRAITLA